MFHETFLTSTFPERRLPEGITIRPDNLQSGNVQDRRCSYDRRTHQIFIGIQAVHHEKPTLEAREVTKLHDHDSTSSNDEFPSYAHSIKLISTRSTTDPVSNETLDLYPEGATLSKFFHEGRPTTTKPTFVALPYLTSHSTFYECLRGIPCQPQDSCHSPLWKLGVIISYSICLERRITSPSTYIIHWNITTESTAKKWIYSTSRNSMTFKLVSLLPSPLSNRRKSYLYRFLCLHGNNLY